MSEIRNDLTRTILAVLFIGGMIAASLWIMQAFIAAGIWATMIVVATWPLMLQVQARLWNRRELAVGVMTVALLLVVIVPLALVIMAIVDHAKQIEDWITTLTTAAIPPPPDWVAGLPLVGPKLAQFWARAAGSGLPELFARATPYAATVVQWFATQAGNVASLAILALATVLISALLYARGEMAAAGVLRFARRLAGPEGEPVVLLAAQAIRGVAIGVVVTALIQALLGGIGLALAGVPFAGLWTGAMFVLCISQIGALPVLVPAAIWLFWGGDNVWGSLMVAWAVVVGTMDNFLRPYLIRLGSADLPLMLIVVGVIGGLLSIGLIGIFVGPVVLAVSYTLLVAWIAGEKPPAGPGAGADKQP